MAYDAHGDLVPPVLLGSLPTIYHVTESVSINGLPDVVCAHVRDGFALHGRDNPVDGQFVSKLAIFVSSFLRKYVLSVKYIWSVSHLRLSIR